MSSYVFQLYNENGKTNDYVLDKAKSVSAYKGYMMNRLMKMFHYENLPDTIPQYMLEYYLLIGGSCVITEVNGNLYAFMGTFGGEPDPYYRPTLYVVANPALKFSKTFPIWGTDGSIDDKCVFMRNDFMWIGLNPLMSRYANLLAENVITMRTADVILRVVALLSAPDDKTRVAAEHYLHNIEQGKIGVIGENRFFDGIKMQSPPSNNGSYLTQFIELQQYYKGSFYNEIGLQASFNMKREAIGEGEAALNDDTLLPLIDSMYQVRKEDVSRLNELYGLDVVVEFDSVWRENIERTKLELAALKKEGDENGDTNGGAAVSVHEGEDDGNGNDGDNVSVSEDVQSKSEDGENLYEDSEGVTGVGEPSGGGEDEDEVQGVDDEQPGGTDVESEEGKIVAKIVNIVNIGEGGDIDESEFGNENQGCDNDD